MLILTLEFSALGRMLILQVDDIDLVHGMPVCVQIVGGRFGEEKAVAVGKVVDELMNPTPFHF